MFFPPAPSSATTQLPTHYNFGLKVALQNSLKKFTKNRGCKSQSESSNFSSFHSPPNAYSNYKKKHAQTATKTLGP